MWAWRVRTLAARELEEDPLALETSRLGGLEEDPLALETLRLGGLFGTAAEPADSDETRGACMAGRLLAPAGMFDDGMSEGMVSMQTDNRWISPSEGLNHGGLTSDKVSSDSKMCLDEKIARLTGISHSSPWKTKQNESSLADLSPACLSRSSSHDVGVGALPATQLSVDMQQHISDVAVPLAKAVITVAQGEFRVDGRDCDKSTWGSSSGGASAIRRGRPPRSGPRPCHLCKCESTSPDPVDCMKASIDVTLANHMSLFWEFRRRKYRRPYCRHCTSALALSKQRRKFLLVVRNDRG